MIKSLLSKLVSALASTASRHKKKLIAVAILIIGFQIARRKIKTQYIVSIVMFFVKFWGKMMEILPLPAFPNYRFVQPFQFAQENQIPQLATVIDLKQLLTKIKNKQPGALNQLKISVISAVLLNIILYKVDSIYQLIKRKYLPDFSQIGAAQPFQQSISLLKIQFIKNLPSFRVFLASTLSSQLQKINLLQVVNQKKVKDIFVSLISHLQKQTISINEKVLSHKTYAQSTKQYKIAQNYFKTTKQYIQQKRSSKVSSVFKILLYPAATILRGVSTLLKSPQQSLTNQRFAYIQYIYILSLKKFRNNVTWPNMQSKYLFQLVLQELIIFFYSTNFSIVISRRIQYNLKVFMNRISIYFLKKAKCEQKKMMDLLPIFFKIIQEEILVLQRRKDFYERQLINAFKDTKYGIRQNLNLKECRLRNRVLQQIYYKNQIQHIEKDMQAKLYNQRDGLVIEPVATSNRIYQQKDEIQQLMQIYNRADEQKQTTREQMQMMRQLVQ